MNHAALPDLYLKIPTAGRNVEALTETLAAVLPRGSVVDVAVHHDDECPCLAGRSMLDCTCEIVGVRLSYLGRASGGTPAA